MTPSTLKRLAATQRAAQFAIQCAVLGLLSLLLSLGAHAAPRGGERANEEMAPRQPLGVPLMAIVALREQRVSIYDAEGKMLRAPVSTGQSGYETPAGIYSVIQKEAEHYSNLYDDASMPFMQRITWSGIALHAGPLPGHPASHGCIRMPYPFAEHLFTLTRLGMRVIVVPRDVAPVDIVHSILFQPKPLTDQQLLAAAPLAHDGQPMRLGAELSPPTLPPQRLTLKTLAEAKAAEANEAAKKADAARLAALRAAAGAVRFRKALKTAEGALLRAQVQLKDAERAAETAASLQAVRRAEEAKSRLMARVEEAQAELTAAKADGEPAIAAAAAAREAVTAAEALRIAAAAAAKEAATKMAPVSVFISRSTQRLYVRQAFQPLFESPITIVDADTPIGTHIFTALTSSKDGTDVRWSAVTMSQSVYGAEPRSHTRHRLDAATEPAAADADAAKSALDRLALPQEAVERISEVVSPGSSLIISDEPLSRETSKGTEFVVLMSGEPQGGIKMRRRNPMVYDGFVRPYGRFPYRSPYSWW